MKLISEIRKAISERVAETFIVGIKMNAVEFQESAFNLEEIVQLCIEFEKMRFDFVELSGGTYEDWTIAPPIKIDTDNFHLTSVAALMQMQHLGKGLQPVDLGPERDTNRLYKAILDHERTRYSAAAPMDFL
ncbi:NADH oxidase [Aspergillus flavus AF70]|nr:NADH oxidase [Aspergillus flavus AF70]